MPSFIVFLLGPVVDVKFKRRTYAAAAVVLCALATFGCLMLSDRIEFLGVAMFLSSLGAVLNAMAIGGWYGSLMSKEDDAKLGAWLVAANVGGFGVITMIGIGAVRAFPMPVAAALLSAPILFPLVIYALTPAPDPDDRLLHESRAFHGRPGLVGAPAAGAAAAVAVRRAGGVIRPDQHLGRSGPRLSRSEAFVGFFGGLGAVLAGLFGSLIVNTDRQAPGGALALSVRGRAGRGVHAVIDCLAAHAGAVRHRRGWSERGAVGGARAQLHHRSAVARVRTTPFAATQFGLLTCAAALPITYMQWLDGHAYGAGGLTAMYLTDGLCGLGAAALMTLLLRMWMKRARATPA